MNKIKKDTNLSANFAMSPTSCLLHKKQNHFGLDFGSSIMKQESFNSMTNSKQGGIHQGLSRQQQLIGTPGSGGGRGHLKQNQWKYSTNMSFVEGFTEVVEEEKQEDDGGTY